MTERSAPAWAAMKTVAPAPSTNATTGISQKATPPARIVAARAARATARAASAAIISRRRS
jgi:hypothetical protein